MFMVFVLFMVWGVNDVCVANLLLEFCAVEAVDLSQLWEGTC